MYFIHTCISFRIYKPQKTIPVQAISIELHEISLKCCEQRTRKPERENVFKLHGIAEVTSVEEQWQTSDG